MMVENRPGPVGLTNAGVAQGSVFRGRSKKHEETPWLFGKTVTRLGTTIFGNTHMEAFFFSIWKHKPLPQQAPGGSRPIRIRKTET